MSELLLDAAGRRRSPATLPEFHAGRAPRNKGIRYPADPPTIEEIVTVMRRAGDTTHGRRLRGLIVVLRRAGLRIHEALALARGRPGPAPRLAARAPRQGRPAPRSRDGRLGVGTARPVARVARRVAGRAAVLRRERRHAWAAVVGVRRALGAAPSPARPGCGDASRRTSCATRTRSR
jgi:hypothetical protein